MIFLDVNWKKLELSYHPCRKSKMHNSEEEDQICFAYPEFECSEGWHQIIRSTLLCLDRHIRKEKAKRKQVEDLDLRIYSSDFRVDQIKEKFGGLRVYCTYEDDYIKGVIALAEVMAYRTCEISGEPGFLHRQGSQMKTLSPRMASQLGFEPAGKDHRNIILENEARKQQNPQ
jgi:hypothetical protein